MRLKKIIQTTHESSRARHEITQVTANQSLWRRLLNRVAGLFAASD